MKNKPLISIIMPAYNCQNSIIGSIDSVISQSYENWELIIIDDGSTDNTLNTIEKYTKLNSKIKSHPNTTNMGVSETRNRGISLAKGEWIAFLDSDDMWSSNKLLVQYNKAIETKSEFLFTSVNYINEIGKPYKGTFLVPKVVSYNKLLRQNVISTSSVLIMKKHFDKVRMENDEIHEDYATWLKILRTGINAYGVDDILLTYRLYRNSKSGNKIKSVKMTYGVYRFIGLNPLYSIFYTFSHLFGSVIKYKNIL